MAFSSIDNRYPVHTRFLCGGKGIGVIRESSTKIIDPLQLTPPLQHRVE